MWFKFEESSQTFAFILCIVHCEIREENAIYPCRLKDKKLLSLFISPQGRKLVYKRSVLSMKERGHLNESFQ